LSTKTVLPRAIAENDRGVAAPSILIIVEHAADNRGDPERRERIGRHALDFHSQRLAADQKVARAAARRLVSTDAVEYGLFRAPVVEILIGERARSGGGERQVGACLADPNEAIRVGIRQRPQEHRVNNAEQGGARSDSECEHDDGGSGEDRRLAQYAVAVANIAE